MIFDINFHESRFLKKYCQLLQCLQLSKNSFQNHCDLKTKICNIVMLITIQHAIMSNRFFHYSNCHTLTVLRDYCFIKWYNAKIPTTFLRNNRLEQFSPTKLTISIFPQHIFFCKWFVEPSFILQRYNIGVYTIQSALCFPENMEICLLCKLGFVVL